MYLSASSVLFCVIPPPPPSTLFPYTTLFRSTGGGIDLTGPFFQSLGTNGRSCGTCHQASNGMSDTNRSEEHTSELQSRGHLVCRLLLEKKTYCARRSLTSRGSCSCSFDTGSM